MKKMTSIALICVLVFTTIFASACASKTKETTTSEETKQSQAETIDAESDLAYIKEKGSLVVGITEYEPMDFRDGDKWIGFDAELAEMFAKKIGVDVVFQEINWNTKEIELEAKTIDAIWNGMTYTDERAEQMGLSQAYLNNAQCLVVSNEKADTINSIEDLTGLQVAAEAGSAGESFVLDNIPDANYIEKNSQLDSLIELALGTVDAVVIDLIMAEYLTNKEGGDFNSLIAKPDVLGAVIEDYVVGFRKGSDMVDQVNSFFDGIKASGELEAVAEKFSLTEALVK